MGNDQETSSFSLREKHLWVELLAHLAIALYFLPKLYSMMQRGDAALQSAAMGNLIIGVIMVAIVVTTALTIFLRTHQDPEPKDERDRVIDIRGHLIHAWVLQGGTILLIIAIALQHLPGSSESMAFLEEISLSLEFTPLVIASALLVVLNLAALARDAARLVFYRMGG